MTKRILTLAVTATFVLGGTATAVPTSGEAADARIRATVMERIDEHRELQRDFIWVTVENGVVDLNGRVGGSIARSRAEEVARNVDGTREVRNHLRYDG